MQQISSVSNSLIKNLAKLKQKKYREETGTYLIEGFHLIQEALKAGEKYQYLLGTASALDKLEEISEVDLEDKHVLLINKAIVQHLSAAKNSQEIFMVLKISQPTKYSFNYGKWVLLDDIADPGNAGTIIRTADACGFDGVILSLKSVDLYNPKTQRAMQGSQFHIKLLVTDITEAISELLSQEIPVYASLLDDQAEKLDDFEKVPQLGIVIGNEAHGVSPEIVSLCTKKLYIPIKGQAESFNAAVASGIIIFHFS